MDISRSLSDVSLSTGVYMQTAFLDLHLQEISGEAQRKATACQHRPRAWGRNAPAAPCGLARSA